MPIYPVTELPFSKLDKAYEILFADPELAADAIAVQFAASDEPANRLRADIQPTSDRGDIEQRRAIDLMMRGVRRWSRPGSMSNNVVPLAVVRFVRLYRRIAGHHRSHLYCRSL